MKMRLNEGLFDDSALYEIKGYYDTKQIYASSYR